MQRQVALDAVAPPLPKRGADPSPAQQSFANRVATLKEFIMLEEYVWMSNHSMRAGERRPGASLEILHDVVRSNPCDS